MSENSNEILTSCPKCKKKYDDKIIPLELPCGHYYCKQCLTEYAESNQNKTKCFSENKECQKEIYIFALKIPYSFYYNIILNKTPEQYMCSKHKEEFIKFVCEEHKEFMCCLCLFHHSDHQKSTRIYLEDELLQDLDKIDKKFQEMTEWIDLLKSQLKDIKMKKIHHSEELKEFFKLAEKFITTPFSMSICDENKRFPLVNINSLIIPPKEEIKAPTDFEESLILPPASRTPNDFLSTLFDGKNFKSQLIYRGSRDGFGAAKFHQLCDNKGPTLTLCSWKFSIFFNQKNKT